MYADIPLILSLFVALILVMGLVNAKLFLGNPREPDIGPIETKVLADTGAIHLRIPEHIKIQLKLDEIDKKEVTIADGTRKLVPYVGPVEIRFKKGVIYLTIPKVVPGCEIC